MVGRSDGIAVGILQVGSIRDQSSIEIHSNGPKMGKDDVHVQSVTERPEVMLSGINNTLHQKRRGDVLDEHGLFDERNPLTDCTYPNRGSGPSSEEVRGPKPEPTGTEKAAGNEQSTNDGVAVRDKTVPRTNEKTTEACVFTQRVIPKPLHINSLEFSQEELSILNSTCDELDLEMNMVSSTAMLNVTVTSDQGATKLRARRMPCALPLAPITGNRICYENLLELPIPPHPELLKSMDVVVGELGAQMVRGHPDFHKVRQTMQGRVSRHLLPEMPDLVGNGLFDETYPTSEDLYVSLFKVPKAGNINARLIGDCGPVNPLLPKPGDMGLLSVHVMILGLLSTFVLLQKDADSCFYQFLINPMLSELLKVRVGNKRGHFKVYRWKVMTMGLNHAPKMCQRTANHMTSNAKAMANLSGGGFLEPWVDNFLFGTKTNEDMDRLERCFDDVARAVNMKMKPNVPRGNTMEALGLKFDVSHPDAECHWVQLTDKQRLIMLEGLKMLSNNMPFRNFLELFGLSMWANFTVGRRPLVHWCKVLGYVRSTARQMHNAGTEAWDCIRAVPDGVVDDLRDMVEFLTAARVTLGDLTSPQRYDNHVWTDAALGHHLMAYVRKMDGDLFAAAHPHNTEAIFVAELLAMCNAVLTFPVGMHLHSDNKAARRALLKGHSTSDAGNIILGRLYETVKQAPKVIISYVPTKCNISDAMSRGETWVPIPSAPCRHEDPPELIQWIC